MWKSLARAGALLLALSIGALLVGRAAACTTDAVPPSTLQGEIASAPEDKATADAGSLGGDAGPPPVSIDASAPAFFPATKSAAPILERRPIEPVQDAPRQPSPQQAPR